MLAAIGVRRDGQKVLLFIKNMGRESTAAWRQFLDDLDARGLKRPEFVIVDSAPGPEAALLGLTSQPQTSIHHMLGAPRQGISTPFATRPEIPL